MQDYKTEYQRWLNSSAIDEKTRAELLSVKDNEKEQEDRFYTELEFGTAGLRGILGSQSDCGACRRHFQNIPGTGGARSCHCV